MHTPFLQTPLLPLLALAAPATAQFRQSANPNCNCWQTSLTDNPFNFQHYQFHDFRAIPADGDNDFAEEPPAIQADQDTGNEEPTSALFEDQDFRDDWIVQSWSRESRMEAPVRVVNSAGNVFITKQDPSSGSSPTQLSLRTSRLPSFQSTAELSTAEENIQYASTRVRARVHGAAGAIAGMFLYFDDDNESDTEIATRDPRDTVRLTNHPGVDDEGQPIPEATSRIALPGNSTWEDWHEYRLDWMDGLSEWFVDNTSVARKTYGVPLHPTHFHLNAWSNGGSWSGNMSVGDQVRLDVQWVELVYNVSGQSPAACDKLCAVDGQPGLETARVEGAAGRLEVVFVWMLVGWVMAVVL